MKQFIIFLIGIFLMLCSIISIKIIGGMASYAFASNYGFIGILSAVSFNFSIITITTIALVMITIGLLVFIKHMVNRKVIFLYVRKNK